MCHLVFSNSICRGWSRHFNYMGDLSMSLAMCLCCGMDLTNSGIFAMPIAYFYIVYMTILLVHRTGRDDDRCRAKYGRFWDEYRSIVPYNMIPYVW